MGRDEEMDRCDRSGSCVRQMPRWRTQRPISLTCPVVARYGRPVRLPRMHRLHGLNGSAPAVTGAAACRRGILFEMRALSIASCSCYRLTSSPSILTRMRKPRVKV